MIKMDKPFNIVTLRNSRCELNTRALHRLLDPIKDTSVAVIGVVGRKQTGKSFVLNFGLRFLASGSDEKDSEWMGRPDEALEGIVIAFNLLFIKCLITELRL